MNAKTKKVNGVDCSRHSFAYVGDEQKTDTWICCIRIPDNDVRKTVNAVKNALARFDETKGIPCSEKQRVFDTIRGAALSQGINVEQRTFGAKNDSPAPAETVEVDPEVKRLLAMADRQADAMLAAMGLD